jgi:hypothetical protein
MPVLAGLTMAIALQVAIPKSYTVVPRWPLIALEILLKDSRAVRVQLGRHPVSVARRIEQVDDERLVSSHTSPVRHQDQCPDDYAWLASLEHTIEFGEACGRR